MHERKTTMQYTPDLEALTRKKRVCAYARVSSDRDEAFHSLSAQISYYQKKIADHPDWEYAGVYSDRGITGTKEERPGFQAMLEACRKKEVDIVLAKSITRFARNTVILLETVRELRNLGIDIHFEEEHIETLSTKGEFMISILAARAQEESRSASENQLWRIRKSYEKGIPVTGNCLGYRMVNHQFLIDEEEEQIVLRIFSMYLSGMGTTAIAKKLNQEGIKTRLGNCPWSREAIFRIIRNEKYCGELRLQKWFVSDHINKEKKKNHGERPMYIIQDNHDAIISREKFDETQKEIARRAKQHNPQNSIHHFAFTSLIRCAHCQKHFVRNVANAGTDYAKPAWACPTSIHYGKEQCQSTQRIPEDILTSVTCDALDISKLDEVALRSRIEEIVVSEKNMLTFVLKDGSEKRVEWHHHSRRESWTSEMKEKARQRSIAWLKRKVEKEDSNGPQSTS